MSRENLYLLTDRKGRKYLVRTRPGGRFSHHRGTVEHAAIEAAGPGGVVETHKGEPLWVRRPSLEEYVLLMPRSATVTYPKDAAAIVMMLDLEPGMRVLEAGSGSGGLTLFLARAVGDAGEVVSYERRPAFLERARANVAAWGAKNVRFFLGDLAEAELEEAGFDGVAIDLMEPWKVLDPVERALKPGRSAVFYLPNITQVVELLQSTEGHPLRLERVVEVHHRSWEVRPPVAHPSFRQIGHTAFLVELQRTREAKGGPNREKQETRGDEKERPVAEALRDRDTDQGPDRPGSAG